MTSRCNTVHLNGGVATLPRWQHGANYEVTGGGGIDLSFVRVADDPLGGSSHLSLRWFGQNNRPIL